MGWHLSEAHLNYSQHNFLIHSRPAQTSTPRSTVTCGTGLCAWRQSFCKLGQLQQGSECARGSEKRMQKYQNGNARACQKKPSSRVWPWHRSLWRCLWRCYGAAAPEEPEVKHLMFSFEQVWIHVFNTEKNELKTGAHKTLLNCLPVWWS